MIRKLTKAEADWVISLGDCLEKKPKSIELFADGKINIVDTKEQINNQKNPNSKFQPLFIMPFYCDGGDPWQI